MKPLEIIRLEESSDWDRNAEFYRAEDQSLLMADLAARRERFYGICAERRVLDVGCGAGATVARLRAGGVDAVGVDYSPAMIEGARRKYGLGQHVECADATALPFESNSFDVVIANGVFHHLAVQGRLMDALSEVHRVLIPGGGLCCFDRNGSAISGAMSGLCIRLKDALRVATRRELFPSCASRNEVAFGGRRDLQMIRDSGFRMLRRKDVSTLPFFFCVVVLNAVQYFLSQRLRSRMERRLTRAMSWIDVRYARHWLCIEQFIIFEATPRAVRRHASSVEYNTDNCDAVAGLSAVAS